MRISPYRNTDSDLNRTESSNRMLHSSWRINLFSRFNFRFWGFKNQTRRVLARAFWFPSSSLSVSLNVYHRYLMRSAALPWMGGMIQFRSAFDWSLGLGCWYPQSGVFDEKVVTYPFSFASWIGYQILFNFRIFFKIHSMNSLASSS